MGEPAETEEGGFGVHAPLEQAHGAHILGDLGHIGAETVEHGMHAIDAMHSSWGAASGAIPAVTSDAAAFGRGAGGFLTSGATPASHIAAEGSERVVQAAMRAGQSAETAEDIAAAGLGGVGTRMGMMNAAGGILGAAGVGLGIYQMGSGISEMAHGEGSQGTLDLLAGGLGTAAGLGGLGVAATAAGATGGLGAAAGMASTLACPPVAIAAALAGLGALGNEGAQRDGWYGTHQDAEGHDVNSTFMGSIGETGSSAYHGIDNAVEGALGNNWFGRGAGAALGGIGAGVAGAGQTVWNGAAAITHGIGDVGSMVGHGIGSAAEAVWDFLSDVRLKSNVAPIVDALSLIA